MNTLFYYIASLASSEESGKDWSELEEEAAAADRDRNDFVDDYTKKRSKHSDKGSMKRSHDHGHHSNHKNGIKKIRKH